MSDSVEGPGVDDDDSNTNLWVAGVVGGEFFLKPRFSPGGEVGHEWLDVGDDSDSDESVLATTAESRVRWNFP
ncbi:MAG: hypothetical protein WEG36_04580 [Gemmatimonadota bacterium]